MQQLFSADVSFNQTEDFLQDSRHRQKLKMKFRRMLIFAILVVILASIYCVYSLHFKTPSGDNQLLLSNTQERPSQLSSNGHEKHFRSHNSPDSRQPHPKEPSTEESQFDFGFQLFPKGVKTKNAEHKEEGSMTDGGDLQQQEDEPKETFTRDNDDSVSDADLSTHNVARKTHSTAAQTESDPGSSELQKRFQQQQILLEQQAQLLQLLQEQIQGPRLQDPEPNQLSQQQRPEQPLKDVSDQPMSDMLDHTTKPTTVLTTKPTTVQTQILTQTTASNKQPSNLPVTEKNSYGAENSGFLLDQVESFSGEIKGMFQGLIKKSEPVQLFVNGIQRTKDTKLTQAETVHENPAAEEKTGLGAPREGGRNRNKPPPTQHSPRHTKDSFGHQLESEVKEVIEKHQNDDLLKDEFEKIEGDFEDAKPGFEPEVGIENHTQSTPPTLDKQPDQNNDHKEQSKNGDTPAHAKPASGQPVFVFNLSQPVEMGHYLCSQSRLTVYSCTICTDPEAFEQMIDKGSPEEQELKEFQEALLSVEDLAAVDLGAGLGLYTVAAADMHRPVLAVEPYKNNVRLFHKTMQLNHFTDIVTLVTDALGEHIGVGIFHESDERGRAKAVFVDHVDPAEAMRRPQDLVRIVRLDDLLPVMTFSRAVLKIDVPGAAHKVLKGATRFFRQIDVQFVFMHWSFSTYGLQCIEAEALLRKYGLEPAPTVHGEDVYTDKDLRKDHHFVVWRKSEQ